jgi:hypothetical protein
MSRPLCPLLAFAAAALLGTALAAAQPPSQTPAAPPTADSPRPQQPRGPRPAPTNIKALPKDISGDAVIKLMREYTGALGVECEFCHAENPETHRINFASDANPTKETARYMIAMTAELNAHLDEMPDKMYADPITCGTCHRGEKHPSVFVPKPRAEGPRPPAGGTVPAAVKPSGH